MDYEHLARFAVADMDAARPLAVLTVPSGCRNAACAGVGSLFRLASRTWPDQIYAVLCDDGDDASNSHCEEAERSGALEPEAPLVTTWDGWRWAPYAGRRDLDSLREALTLLLADGGAAAPAAALRSRPPFTCDADAGVPLVAGRLQAWPHQALPAQIFLPNPTARSATAEGKRAVALFPPTSPPDGGRFDGGSVGDAHSLRGLLRSNATLAARFPFIALFPCSTCDEAGAPRRQVYGPTGGPPRTGDYGWTPQNFERLDALVAAAICVHGGDAARIVLSGESYGGHGLWNYAAARPGVFSALVPVVSSFLPSSKIADAVCCAEAPAACCPAVWIHHGANDAKASIEIADWWATTLRAQRQRPPHREVRYSRYSAEATREAFLRVYPGAANPFGGDEWEAHFGASTIAFGDEAFHDWLLQQVCEGCAPPV